MDQRRSHCEFPLQQAPSSQSHGIGSGLKLLSGCPSNHPRSTTSSPWPGDQPLAHRIEMHIIDHRLQRARRDDIAIVAAARLPKVMFDLLASLHTQPRQPVGSMRLEILHGFAADRFFEPFEEVRIVVRPLARPHDQMDMIGHEDIGPQCIVQLASGFVNGVRQPLATAVLGQEWITAITRTGQFVSMAGIVVASWTAQPSAMVHAAFLPDSRRGIPVSVESRDTPHIAHALDRGFLRKTSVQPRPPTASIAITPPSAAS